MLRRAKHERSRAAPPATTHAPQSPTAPRDGAPPRPPPDMPALPDGAAYEPDPRDDADPLAPPPHLREAAFRSTGETYVRRKHGLQEVRALIRQHGQRQLRLPEAERVPLERTSDDFLIVFLRAKKFRVDAAFKEFCNFSRAQAEHVWLRDIDLALVERLFSSGSFQILPRCDRKGRLILSMDLKVLIPFVEQLGRDRTRHLLTAIFAMLETIMKDVSAQIFGVVIISDLTGCKLRTFGFLSLQQYMLSLDLCQHCYPIRASGMYLIHEPWYVKGLFSAMRPFMKHTVKENLRCFGGDVSGIHELIPREALLPTYGGVLKLDNTTQTKAWVDAVRRTFS